MCCAWTIKDIAWKRKMKAEMMKLRGFSDDVRFPGSVALIYIRLSLFFFFFFFKISGTPASYFIFERISNSRSVLCKRWHWGGSMEPGSDKVISLSALAPMALRGTWGSGSITSMMLGFSCSWEWMSWTRDRANSYPVMESARGN